MWTLSDGRSVFGDLVSGDIVPGAGSQTFSILTQCSLEASIRQPRALEVVQKAIYSAASTVKYETSTLKRWRLGTPSAEENRAEGAWRAAVDPSERKLKCKAYHDLRSKRVTEGKIFRLQSLNPRLVGQKSPSVLFVDGEPTRSRQAWSDGLHVYLSARYGAPSGEQQAKLACWESLSESVRAHLRGGGKTLCFSVLDGFSAVCAASGNKRGGADGIVSEMLIALPTHVKVWIIVLFQLYAFGAGTERHGET